MAFYDHQYYVYIMANQSNSTLYIGVTNDLLRRVHEHQEKISVGFTAKYNLSKLLFYEFTSNVLSAIEREKQLKGWTRVKKLQLISRQNPYLKDLTDQL